MWQTLLGVHSVSALIFFLRTIIPVSRGATMYPLKSSISHLANEMRALCAASTERTCVGPHLSLLPFSHYLPRCWLKR